MSDPYEKVKGGRLAFKGGDLATTIKKNKKNQKQKKKKKNKEKLDDGGADVEKIAPDDVPATSSAADGKDNDIYSIDAAKKRKYDELFPVEAKKFGYVPKSNFDSVAEALDDRVKKKADRYCK